MSTDRLGELRARALPHVLRYLAERGGAAGEAGRTLRAQETFDRAVINARHIHKQFGDEERDKHMGRLLGAFSEAAGIPALEALPIVEEFVLQEGTP